MYYGTLIVRPITARLTYDTEWFARMDPYCKVTVGGTVQQTGVAVNQSKTPSWQDTLTFRVNNDMSMNVLLFDKDYVTRDDYIAECNINLQEVYNKRVHNGWYPVNHKGRPAGQIMISFEFRPENQAMGMGMGGMGMPNMGMGMSNMGMGMNNMGYNNPMSMGMGMNTMGGYGNPMSMGMGMGAGYGNNMNMGMGMGYGNTMDMGLGMGSLNGGMGYNPQYNNPNLPPGFLGSF